MTPTGAVRRIDALGRFVIPQQVRQSLHIRPGTSLAFSVNGDGAVVLGKYSPVGALGGIASNYADSLHAATGLVALITDAGTVVAAAGDATLLDQPIGSAVEEAMARCRSVTHGSGGPYSGAVVKDDDRFASFVVAPILMGADPQGSVILASRRDEAAVGVAEANLARAAAAFLGRLIGE